MLRIRDTGAMSQCRNFHLYRNEQGKQGVIDGRRNVFVPARYDTLIMRDTIWGIGSAISKNTQVSMCISTD